MSFRNGLIFSRLVAAFLIAGCFLPAHAAPSDAPSLRYAWKQGDEHAFKVEITIDTDDEEITHRGTPVYNVTASDENGIALQFNGSLVRTSKYKSQPGAFPRSPFPQGFGRPSFPTARTLTINDRGKVITEQGNSQLPYLLGDLAHLLLVPLPKKNDEKTWTVNRETTITVSESSGFRHPFFDRAEKKNVRAEEETVYAISKTDGDLVTVLESYSLEALERVKGKPSMEMIGDGAYTFDTKLGGPTSYVSKISVVLREGNTTTEIPITVSMQRLTPEELAASRKEAAAAVEKMKADAEARKQAEEAEKRKPIEPTELAALIDDLTTDDARKTQQALDKLSKKIPLEPDPKVSAALMRHVGSKNLQHNRAATAALIHWGTKESVPALLEALDSKDPWVLEPAVQVLARFPSKEVAAAVGPLLANHAVPREKLAVTLVAMGSAAEEPVIAHLAARDPNLQIEATKILAKVGGEKSLKALAAATSPFPHVKEEFTKATAEIKKRASEQEK